MLQRKTLWCFNIPEVLSNSEMLKDLWAPSKFSNPSEPVEAFSALVAASKRHGACCAAGMRARRLEDLEVWQLANDFKLEVYRLFRERPKASHDFRFSDQLRSSAASAGINIAEGFHRYRHGEFRHFLNIALGSLGEAKLWLHDGVDRGYFEIADCARAWALANRCRAATLRLHARLR